jgi:hypothetical protein
LAGGVPVTRTDTGSTKKWAEAAQFAEQPVSIQLESGIKEEEVMKGWDGDGLDRSGARG